MIQKPAEEIKEPNHKAQNYYFQIILLKLSSTSNALHQINQLKFTINKGRHKFEETQYAKGTFQGQNTMVLSNKPKLNFVVINYSTLKSQQFSLKITDRKDNVQRQLGEYVINCNVYVDNFLKNNSGAFEETIILDNDLQLNIELFIEKKRYLIQKLVREIHSQQQKNKQPKLYNKLQKIIQKNTFVKKDPLKSQTQTRSNSFKRNISIKQLKQQLQTSRSRSKQRKQILASPHKLRLIGIDRPQIKSNIAFSPLEQKIQKVIPAQTNIQKNEIILVTEKTSQNPNIQQQIIDIQTPHNMQKAQIQQNIKRRQEKLNGNAVQPEKPSIDNIITQKPQNLNIQQQIIDIKTQQNIQKAQIQQNIRRREEKLYGNVVQPEKPVIDNTTIDPSPVKANQQTNTITIQHTQQKNTQLITPANANLNIQQIKTEIQTKQEKQIVQQQIIQIKQQNINNINTQQQKNREQKKVQDPIVQNPPQVQQNLAHQNTQQIKDVIKVNFNVELIKNQQFSQPQHQILIVQDIQQNIISQQKQKQPIQNNIEVNNKQINKPFIQLRKTQSDYITIQKVQTQSKQLKQSQTNKNQLQQSQNAIKQIRQSQIFRNQLSQTPHFASQSKQMLQFITQSLEQASQNIAQIKIPPTDSKLITSQTSIDKAEQSAVKNNQLNPQKTDINLQGFTQLQLKNKIMIVTFAFLIILLAYMLINHMSTPNQSLKIKKAKQAPKTKPQVTKPTAKPTVAQQPVKSKTVQPTVKAAKEIHKIKTNKK